MDEKVILDWLELNKPIECDSAWQSFKDQITRKDFRVIWHKYKEIKKSPSVESWVAQQKDFIRGQDIKVLFLDIEVSEGVGTFYDAYKGRIRRILQGQIIMSVSWQFQDEDEVHVRKLPDYAGYTPGIFNMDDRALCEELYPIINSAHLIVGHNAKKFDLKILNQRFFKHGLMPTEKFVVEDTLLMLWKYFALQRNTLDYACDFIGLPSKTRLRHSDFVDGCYEGNMEDWDGLATYNQKDVFITRAFYAKISPWHHTHHNLNLIKRAGQLCYVCLANGKEGKDYRKAEPRYTKTFARQGYTCNNCGFSWSGEVIARSTKLEGTDVELERINQFNV